MLWASLFLVAVCEAASYGSVLDLPGSAPIAVSGTVLVVAQPPAALALYEQTVSAWVLRRRLLTNASATNAGVTDVAGNLIVVAQTESLFFFRFNSSDSGDGEVTNLAPVFATSGVKCISVHIVNSTVYCGSCSQVLQCARVLMFEEQSPNVWQAAGSIDSPDPASQAFGGQIVGGDRVLAVSDYYYGGRDEGGVFFYERGSGGDAWQLVGQVRGTQGGEELGCGLAIDPAESTVMAGSHQHMAHLYSRNASGGWEERSVLTQAQDSFGLNGRFLQNGELLVVQSASAVNIFDTADLSLLQSIPLIYTGLAVRFGLASVVGGSTFLAAQQNAGVAVFGLVPPPISAVVIACTVLVVVALVAIVVGFFVVRCVRQRRRASYAQLRD